MKRTSTLPYFQLDGGAVLLSCMGLSMEERGMYFTLLAIYWEGNCKLPSRDALVKKMGLRGKKDLALLESVLEAFFPDGVNEHLDQCRENALKASRINSSNAKKGHEQRKEKKETHETLQGSEEDPLDF